MYDIKLIISTLICWHKTDLRSIIKNWRYGVFYHFQVFFNIFEVSAAIRLSKLIIRVIRGLSTLNMF